MAEPLGFNQELQEFVRGLVRYHERGRFPQEPDRRLFEDPILAVAWASDPMFKSLKKIIGTFHQLPVQILRDAFPGRRIDEEEVYVVCYALPITQATRLANSSQYRYPHRDWMLTKIHGEAFNEWLRAELVRWIMGKGHMAAAPILQPSYIQFPHLNGDITSNWSERHACFVAGLGTFGLSRGLITQAGMAVRLGTVVTDLPLKPTARDYDSPFAHCLFLASGRCGICIRRCPAGAITPWGQDKQKCQAHQIAALKRKGRDLGLGLQLSGLHLSCGLCQTGVPCEQGIPRPGSKDLQGASGP
ncbi:MAG: epoxyqueuosine reductase [bacterium]